MSFGGGSGSSSIAGSTDVVLTSPANNEVLTYNSGSSKWQNQVPTGGTAVPGTVQLDSFAGATDDIKLSAAMSYASGQTYPPTIMLSNRQYNFAVGGLVPFRGMRIWGPVGYSNPEQAGQTKMTCQVHLSMSGGWFVNSSVSDTFSVSFGQLSFVGTGTAASVLTQGAGAGTLYCLQMRDISTTGLKSVLGTQSSKLLITAATFDGGAWEINNCYSGAFHLGGSDNTLWPDGMLLDSGTAFNTAGSAAGQYHLWCDSLDKTYVGPLYITCEGNWGGIKVSGSAYNTGATNAGIVGFHGARIEGRNPAQPCNGANVLVTGGQATLNNCWFGYGMDTPASMGHTPTDAGVVHQSAGRVIMTNCQYDRTSGQAETVPLGYCSGGTMRVRDLSVGSRGGTWTGLPRIKDGGGTVVVDDTATAI